MDLRTGEEQAEETALREEIEKLRSQRAEFDRELIRRAYRIDELERLVRETEGHFVTSLSWRLTAPIRVLKARLKDRLRR